MKHLYLLATCLFVLGSSLSLFAQNSKRVPDPQNTREGEHVEYCITHKKHNALLSNSAYVQGLQEAEMAYELVAKKRQSTKRNNLYYSSRVSRHALWGYRKHF